MKRRFNYKAATWILAFLVILQAIFISYLIKPKPHAQAKKKIRHKVAVIQKGKIAIVLDDFGYNTKNIALLKTIKQPLTVSVLPNLSYSQEIAEDLNAAGLEVILHLPLEPQEEIRLEKDTILTGMDEKTVAAIVERDLENIHFAKGISNHMGSKATESQRTMRFIFNAMKKRRLYFLDSFVSGNSVCRNLAAEFRISFAKRDIFLDNEMQADSIKQQFYRLKAMAEKFGQAIGIGHDRKLTIEVLKELMPEFKKQGFKFVFVSDLVR